MKIKNMPDLIDAVEKTVRKDRFFTVEARYSRHDTPTFQWCIYVETKDGDEGDQWEDDTPQKTWDLYSKGTKKPSDPKKQAELVK